MHFPRSLSVNRAIQILLLFLFVLNVGDGLFTPILAVFIEDFIEGATLATVGFATALFALSKSLVQIPLAHYLDKQKGEKDDFYVMLLGALIGITFPLLIIRATYTWQLYMLHVLIGVGAACLMAAYYSVFSHHIDRDRQGYEWSLFSVGGVTISAAIGGAVGGVVADVYGFHILFLSSASLNALGAFMLLWLYPYMERVRIPVARKRK